MHVTCPKCKTVHHVAAVPDGGLSYVCPSCSHCFHVEAETSSYAPSLSLGGARVLGGAPQGADSNLDYFVKRSNKLVIGPFKRRMVEQMIRSGQVDTTTEVSTDKAQWLILNSLPEFASIFQEDHRPGVAARTSAPSLPAPKPPAPSLPAPKPPALSLPALKPPTPALPALKPTAPGGLRIQPASLADIGHDDLRPSPKLRDVSIGEFPIAGAQRDDDPWEPDFEEFDAPPPSDELPKVRPLDSLDDLPKPRSKASPSRRSDITTPRPELPSLKPTQGRTVLTPKAPHSTANTFPTPRFIDPADVPNLPHLGGVPVKPPLDFDLPAPQRGVDDLSLGLDLPAPQREGDDLGLGLDFDLPSNQQHLPSNQQHLPSNQQHLPSNQQHLPSNQQHLPSHQQHLPSHQQHLPSHQQHLPSHQQHLPSHQQHLPSHQHHDLGIDFDLSPPSHQGLQSNHLDLLIPPAPLLPSSPTEFDPLPLLNPSAPLGSFSEPRMNTSLGRPPLPDVSEPLPLLADARLSSSSSLLNDDDLDDLGYEEDSLFNPSLGQTQAGLPNRDLSAFSPLSFDDDPLGLNRSAPPSAPPLMLELNTGLSPASPPTPNLDYGMLDLDIPPLASPSGPPPPYAPPISSAPSPPLTTNEPHTAAPPLSAEERHARAQAQKTAQATHSPPPPRSRRLLLIAATLLLVAAGAIGALYALKIGPFHQSPPSARPASIRKPPAPTTSPSTLTLPDDASALSPNPLKADTFSTYTQYIAATDALLESDPTPRGQALFILAHALMFSRYPEMKTPDALQNISPLQDISLLAPESPWHALISASNALIQNKLDAGATQTLISKTDMPFFGHLLFGTSHLSLAAAAPPAERSALLTKAQESFERALKEDDKAPIAHALLAQSLELNQKKSSAIESYTQAISLNPSHIPALLALSHLYLRDAQPDRARDLLNRVFNPDLFPQASPLEQAQAQYLSGLYDLSTNNLPSAISTFQQALSLGLRSDDLIRDTAEAYDRNQQPGAGATFFTETFGEKPTDLEPLLALARLRTSEARITRNPAYALEQAQRFIDAALAAFPDHPRALLALATLQLTQNKPDLAQATFQRVLDANPDNIDARIELAGILLADPTATTADALIKDLSSQPLSNPQRARLGSLLLSHPSHARAGVTLLEELCVTSSAAIPSREALVTYYIQNKDFAKALEHLEAIRRALALRPSTRYQLALVLFSTGSDRARLDRASELLADTLKDDPDHTDASLLLGQILFTQEKYTQAHAIFEQVIAKRPRDHLALFFLGRCELSAQNPTAAIPHLRSAYEIDRNQGEYALFLAMALEADNNAVDALRLYSDVIRTPFAEKDHRPHLLRARILRPQGSSKRKAAILDLQRALSINPSAPDIHEELSRALFEDRKFEQALDALLVIEQEYKHTLSAEGYLVRGLAHASLIKGGPTEASHRAAAIAALEAARDAHYPDLKRPAPLVGMNEPAMLYRYLGYLYRDAGQKALAIESFERYLDLARAIDTSERRSITGEIFRLKG